MSTEELPPAAPQNPRAGIELVNAARSAYFRDKIVVGREEDGDRDLVLRHNFDDWFNLFAAPEFGITANADPLDAIRRVKAYLDAQGNTADADPRDPFLRLEAYLKAQRDQQQAPVEPAGVKLGWLRNLKEKLPQRKAVIQAKQMQEKAILEKQQIMARFEENFLLPVYHALHLLTKSIHISSRNEERDDVNEALDVLLKGDFFRYGSNISRNWILAMSLVAIIKDNKPEDVGLGSVLKDPYNVRYDAPKITPQILKVRNSNAKDEDDILLFGRYQNVEMKTADLLSYCVLGWVRDVVRAAAGEIRYMKYDSSGKNVMVPSIIKQVLNNLQSLPLLTDKKNLDVSGKLPTIYNNLRYDERKRHDVSVTDDYRTLIKMAFRVFKGQSPVLTAQWPDVTDLTILNERCFPAWDEGNIDKNFYNSLEKLMETINTVSLNDVHVDVYNGTRLGGGGASASRNAPAAVVLCVLAALASALA